ncbi:serine/threonine-protein kinase [Haloechinothrix salitolerans]|uniref:non-specific serine/threonine protein kinase n=1 Tax=Haloechinothrix salitolerans TaxID=926830 RepID=A0ABW2BZ97_9PSEU
MASRKVMNDRYELQRVPLARGGMGEVWEGHDTKLDREIAVKFVRFHDGVRDDELVKRFVRESRITARLQHPGVPAVFDVGTDEAGRPYLVMQRVRGTSVSDLLAENEQLSIGWSVAIAAQVCSVLSAAHQASLVHRDLKPANLMLEPDGTVKVLDFGLAVALDLTEGSQITRTGQSIGTPAYMAPEQALAATSGPQTDLYALGCTLYEMLTGRHVFSGPTSYAVMNKQVDESPKSAREYRAEIPAELDELLLALLEKKPENRPASAHVVYERLLPLVTDVRPMPGLSQPPGVSTPARMYATVLSRAFDVDTTPVAAAPSPEPEIEPVRDTQLPAVTRLDVEEARAEAGELAQQARYAEAADVLRTNVEAASATFGATDPGVMNARLEWANVLFEGGDYRAAAPVYDALTVDLAEQHGPDAELVFRCRAQYATCHAKLGDMTTAIDAARRLLADQQRVYAPRDPRPFELRRQIGVWQLSAGQREEAERTLRELLRDLLEAYGESYPAVPKIRDILDALPKQERIDK